jgi:Domain of unknown function (DUF4126)
MDLGAIAGSSWASGLNLYAVVALLGAGGRLGWVDSPDALQQWWVIALSIFFYAIEFVADKIPLVDSTWDAVHTVVRPVGAAALSMVMAGQQPTPQKLLMAVGAGGLALTSHAAKATTRLAANTSPEPASNILLSIGEDGLVIAMFALISGHPRVAGGVALVLAVICVLIVIKLWKFAKKLITRIKRLFGQGPGDVKIV